MMRTASRVCIALVVLGGLIWAASSLGTSKSSQPVSGQGRGTPSVLDGQSGTSPQLAGRYHLRRRTTRFFKRSSGWYRSHRHTVGRRISSVVEPDSGLAGRYHLRSRTKRFFDRSKSPQLAARYHLRSRTTRFFHRAVC